MAGFFSENGVRITPAGIFRGRDAIGRELQRVVINLGLHDYPARIPKGRGVSQPLPRNGCSWRPRIVYLPNTTNHQKPRRLT
jgi:hypothetical protein